MDARVFDPPLRHLAKRGVRDSALVGNDPPFALAGLKHSQNCVVHGSVHDRHYPHADENCNPQVDKYLQHNPRMDGAQQQRKKTLRELIAEKIAPKVDELGQAEFAKKAKIGQGTVSRVCNLRQDVTISMLEKLGKMVGLLPYEMLIDGENMRREVVERFLQPIPPAAPAPANLPEARTADKGEGERAMDVVALHTKGSKKIPAIARVVEAPNRRSGARRKQTKRP
jgi:hypothetical protein